MTGDNVCHEDAALACLFVKDNRKEQAILQPTVALNLTQIVNIFFLKKRFFEIQHTVSCLDLTSQIMDIPDQLALMNF